MKTKSWSILKYNKFEFGKQHVSQFVVFECKYLFSIIFFYFHKCNAHQDRFHTHAFNAVSFKIFGQYLESKLISEKRGTIMYKMRKEFFKYFPRNSYHRIGYSTGCLTLLLSSPWKKNWKEYITETKEIKHYNWGRNHEQRNNN